MNKKLSEIKKGDVFRPAGAVDWLTATADADSSDGARGVCRVRVAPPHGRIVGLGHLQCEIRSAA